MELRIILAKLYWNFDVELLDRNVDWHGASRMHTLWKKPGVNVKVFNRAKTDSET